MTENGCCEACDDSAAQGNAEFRSTGEGALGFFGHGTEGEFMAEFIDCKLANCVRDLSAGIIWSSGAGQRTMKH